MTQTNSPPSSPLPPSGILTHSFLNAILLMWFMQFTTLGFEYSSCHVQFYVLIHTHTHTHFSILKTDICSEVSVAWICGLILFLSFIKSFIMCSFLCVCGDARVIQIAPDYTSEGNGSRGLQRRWFWSSQLSSCFLTRPVTALFAGINCCNLWFFFFFLLLELL